MLSFFLVHKIFMFYIKGTLELKLELEYGRAGTTVTCALRYQSFVQPFTSFIQQSRTLNKVQYLTDRDVLKVTWFHKMTTQMPES
jgi:hypothetical protein